jgi:polar amino acid transport system substrate-binding protein
MNGSFGAMAASVALRELAPSGALRVAINCANPVLVQRNVESGMLSGVSVDLACELAKELGVKPQLVPFDASGEAFEAIASGDCDIGFLAIDPERAARLSYTAPYVLIHGGYLTHEHSPFVKAIDVDQPGVRIASVRDAAYDLYLSRTLKHAELVYAATSAGSVDLLLGGGADVAAGIYKPLAEAASIQPGLKMADGYFMVIQQAMTVSKARTIALAYLCEYIERLKKSGFIAEALVRSGQAGVQIAPPVQE